MLNTTNIPAPRVPLVDPETGLISNEWYRYFFNLFVLAGSGGNTTSLDDLQVGPPPQESTGGGGGGSVNSVTGTAPIASTGGANPDISISQATTSTNGYLSSTDWNTFNSKQPAGTYVTSVGATSPVTSTGGATPTIAMPAATTSTDGYLTSTDWNTFNGKGSGTVTSVAATAGTGISVTGSPITTSGTLNTTNAAPDHTVAVASGTGISVTGTYPNFTITNTAPSSGGTVTSVTGTSPVVSSGGNTPAISLASGYGDTQNPYASKTANFVLAAPNGSAGVPTFRAVVAADIPILNQNTTGTASNVTGTVAIANGGTGETTRQAAMDALAGAVTSGQYLRGNGTDVVMSAIQAADVPTLNQNTTGTASNVTGTVAIANGGTGQTTRQDAMDALAGAVTSGQYLRGNGTDVVMSAIQAADVPTLNQNTTGTAANVTGTVAIANGGTGQTTKTAAFDALSPTTTQGDIIYNNGTNNVRLPIGANTYVLTSNGTTVSWSAPAGGGSNITALGMWENNRTISANYTVGTGNSSMSSGPITINSGVSVTVPAGSRWVVL